MRLDCVTFSYMPAPQCDPQVEHVVHCQMTPYQRLLYNLVLKQSQAACSCPSASSKMVTNTVMELRNICNHPLISKLSPPGIEDSLPVHPLHATIRLCGKLEVLDKLLRPL